MSGRKYGGGERKTLLRLDQRERLSVRYGEIRGRENKGVRPVTVDCDV